MKNKELKKLNPIIQVCPKCGKLDVYWNDGHECNRGFQQQRQLNLEYGNS